MDIRCRKTECKFNDKYTCKADEILIKQNMECKRFVRSGRGVVDKTKKIFSNDPPVYAPQRDSATIKIDCKADCLFNDGGKCVANGITLNDIKEKPLCITFLKKWWILKNILQKCLYVLYNKNMDKKNSSASSKDTQQVKKPPELDAKQVEQEYISILGYQIKQKNNLLGKFDGALNYKISDEKILEALINIPKKFDEKKDNVVYASTVFDTLKVVLNFKIEFDINESFGKARLYLIEIQHGIEEDVKHITKLGEIEDVYTHWFREDVYKQWKVYFGEEIYEKKDFLFEYLRWQQEEFLFAKELTEILAKLYLVRMLKLLENSGELGQKINLEYKALIEKFLQQDPSILQNNTKMKEILDFVIMKHKALPLLLKVEGGKEIFNGYSRPIKNIRDKTYDSPVKEVAGKVEKSAPKQTKKEAKKTAKKKGKSGKKIKPYVYNWKSFKAKTNYGGFGFSLESKKKSEPAKTIVNVSNEKPNDIDRTEQRQERETEPKEERIRNNPFAKSVKEINNREEIEERKFDILNKGNENGKITEVHEEIEEREFNNLNEDKKDAEKNNVQLFNEKIVDHKFDSLKPNNKTKFEEKSLGKGREL